MEDFIFSVKWFLSHESTKYLHDGNNGIKACFMSDMEFLLCLWDVI